MPEVPNSGEGEGDAVLVADVADVDDFSVLDRAARLDDGGDAGFGGGFRAVGEREEGGIAATTTRSVGAEALRALPV